MAESRSHSPGDMFQFHFVLRVLLSNIILNATVLVIGNVFVVKMVVVLGGKRRKRVRFPWPNPASWQRQEDPFIAAASDAPQPGGLVRGSAGRNMGAAPGTPDAVSTCSLVTRHETIILKIPPDCHDEPLVQSAKDVLTTVSSSLTELMSSSSSFAGVRGLWHAVCARTREEMDTPMAFISERYRLRPHLLHQVLGMSGLRPEIDAFSCADTKNCDRFWGPESPDGCDAFDQRWDQHILWFNPPYSKMERVVNKILNDKTHGIVVVPEWTTKTWWQPLQRLVVWRWRLPAGTRAFELFHRPCRPTRWAVQILAVCGADPQCGLAELRSGKVHGRTKPVMMKPLGMILARPGAGAFQDPETVQQEPRPPKTRAQKRRDRRKRVVEKWSSLTS